MKNEIKMLYASQLGSLDGIELDNTDDVIEKSVVIEMLKEQIELTKKIEISLKAQEEKHKEEIEKFAEWIVENSFYSINGFWFSDNDLYRLKYTTTELIEMFKKSLDIK